MSQSDLFTAIGMPPMNAADMGVSPPPVAPTPPDIGPPPTLSKPFALALLAGAIAGGRNIGTGLLSGVQKAQEGRTAQYEQQVKLQQQEQLRQQGIQAEQQKQYEATLTRREQEFGAIVNGPRGFYEAVATATSPEQYDQRVQQYASLLQTRGFRVDANKLRAMAPFVVDSDEKKASAVLDGMLKNPMTVELLKTDPARFMASSVPFQSNADEHPRLFPMAQFMALAGRPAAVDPDTGKIIIPEAGTGPIGSAFQEALKSARLAFKAQYNREPTPKEQQALVERAIETTKEKPAGAAAPNVGSFEDYVARYAAELGKKVSTLSTADLRQARTDYEGAKKPEGASADGPSPYATERATRNLQSIDELLTKVSRRTVGVGSLLARVPESEARNFAAELDTLKANIAFGELTAMREASKTGGALGQVSERELALLTAALGALDTGQSPANIKAQLQKIKASIQRWQAAQTVRPAASHAPASGTSIGRFQIVGSE